MRWRDEPPRAVTIVVFTALATLLVYPLHRPYLHPDQDVLPTLPLTQMAWGTWSPLILMYGSALPNLLHVLDLALFWIGRAAGWWRDPADLLIAWCGAPWLFRIPPRVIAAGMGIASLVAARAVAAKATDRWTALAAPALLGTWLVFVREHHHGWYDAPAAGAAMLALWAATAYVHAPSTRWLVAAGAFAGLAMSCKFNLAATIPAVLTAPLAAPAGRRVRDLAIVAVAAALAFVATTPESVLETARLMAYLAIYIPVQSTVLGHAAGNGGNRLFETLGSGIGWSGVAVALAGATVAALERRRVLVPTLAFVAAYGLILVRSPLVMLRYALPIAGPLAILAAYALARLPATARVAATLALVALGLPGSVAYVRLLAVEDTRTEAARLVEAEWARGGRVVFAANPVLASYAAPDRPALPRYERGLPPDVERALAARAPHCGTPLETTQATTLADLAGALVVTSDPPTSEFTRASTGPATTRMLEGDATLVADLTVERTPVERPYEVFDLNYVPLARLGSLTRPGPRMRFWRVPAKAPGKSLP